MSEKLRNCPFCGGKARLNEYKDCEVWYEVRCDECAVRTEQYETVDEAVRVWNRRAEPDHNVHDFEKDARWIPVSKRLPEKETKVLVFSKCYDDCPNCGSKMKGLSNGEEKAL